MLRPKLGLARVSTADLKTALRALHHGDLATPLTIAELARHGLQEPGEELLDQLRGLDADAVRAVLVCVLAERAGAGGRG